MHILMADRVNVVRVAADVTDPGVLWTGTGIRINRAVRFFILGEEA